MMDFNEEFKNYTTQSMHAMEIIPATLYDTQFYVANTTLRLDFFRTIGRTRSISNMEAHGMLPNPKAFLIESIRINGISSNIQYGACMLVIGCKHYGVNPAWTYGMKEKGFKLRPNIMIGQLQNFYFTIDWEKAEPLGHGSLGEITIRPIQVVMFGQMARSIN